MSLTLTTYGQPFSRPQAQLLVELLARQESALRSVLLGRRREGKSDLLLQVQAALFEKADGPIPFRYVFETRRDSASLARHFAASFCQQMRAFGMRQQEMLGEPLARLEKELERPGLPLALTELGREFLALPPVDQLEFAAALPAQFAHREGRPLCLLLDDAELLSGNPAFLSYLGDPRLSWLLTGPGPQMQSMAASRGWSLLSLQPFSVAEALSLAEDRCRQFETPFAPQAWEVWFEMLGTSPGWVHQLVEAAVVTGHLLDSLEALGRIYLQELAFGSLARAMADRWRNVFSAQTPAVQSSSDSSVRLKVAEHLLQSPGGGAAAADFSPALWDGLVAEEWAEVTPLGPAVRLDRVERDWLELAVSTARCGADRALAGLLQAFLLRAEGVRQWRQAGGMLQEIRDHLLELPRSGPLPAPPRGSPRRSPGSSPGSNKDPRLPEVCSIAVERNSTAELYWCYGFRPGWPEERRDRPEAACLYLIALCRQEPASSDVKNWNRRLQEEARALPLLAAAEKPLASGLAPRYELWLALPRGASLAAVAGERRMRWETLAGLLQETGPRLSATLPPMQHLEGVASQARLSELEARAQWLEDELTSAREQFRTETSRNLLVQKSPPGESTLTHPAPEPEDVSSRLALSVSLLLASAELLALQSQADPATLDAVRDIHGRTERLADALRLQEQSRSAGDSPLTPPSPPEP